MEERSQYDAVLLIYGDFCPLSPQQRGFWRPGPHLVLERTICNPETALVLDQYTIIEGDGSLSTYRVWRQDYTPDSINAEVEAGDFEVRSIWGDLTGQLLQAHSEWIGIVASKNKSSVHQ